MSQVLRNFLVPKEIYFGWGSLSQIEKISARNAIIVTGQSSMKSSGVIDKALGYLHNKGVNTEIFDGVEPDPSIETVFKGAQVFSRFQPDLIIGLGGCSAIDAAKVMWILYEHPHAKFDDLIVPFNVPPLGKAKFLAIPSTSGTGTEVSIAAIITNRKLGIKQAVVSPEILPSIVILDPELTLFMPPHVVAHTGLDALTHSIEAYVSTDHSAFTDSVALEATRLISIYLKRSYDNPNDRDAREQMHYASTLAGLAHSNAVLGICHSLAHQLGGMLGITHGVANAILLPYVIKFNATATDRYVQIAKAAGVQNANALVEYFANLTKDLNVSTQISAGNISLELFNSKVYEMAQNALKDDCTLTNPRQTTLDDMVSILKQAF